MRIRPAMSRGTRPARWVALAAAVCVFAAAAPAARAPSEVPAGTRFLVELRDKLDAHKVHEGKKFDARTIEAIRATDGSVIPAWTKVKGRVTYLRDNQMILRFERIEAPGGKQPLVASVVGVVGEKDVRSSAGDEGEIKAKSHRGRNAAIGAVVLGGIGAAAGASQGGARGAGIGAAAGGATGALIGMASGGRTLVLREGTRIELRLDRPLEFRARR